MFALYDHIHDYVHHLDVNNVQLSGRVLGLDIGEKWIGLSLSDTRRVIASPYTVYKRVSLHKDHAFVQMILQSENIDLIIAGLPLNLDGSLSRQGERIYTYCTQLWEHAPLTAAMTFWDERFSTNAVERAMLDHDMTRKKREQRIDKLAATYMLQGALDYLHHQKTQLD